MAMKTTLVLLTFNEIDGLKAVYDKIPIDSVDHILAMDGGSTDGTLDFYKEKKIPFKIQKRGRRGSAMIEALEHVDDDVIIFFSPDGNEDPVDIPKVKDRMEEGYDLVIASRFINGGQSDDSDDPLLIRRFGNNFFTFLSNVFFRVGVTDAINGFRGIRTECFRKLSQDASGHEVEFQMSIRCANNGYKISEIPTIEHERVGGIRKANTWVMGVRFSLFFIKELLSKKTG